MVNEKTDPPILERHRRMAVNHLLPGLTWPQYVKRWVFTGDREDLCGAFLALPSYALFAATVERDAFARGVEDSADRISYGTLIGCRNDGERVVRIRERIRALLPKPPHVVAVDRTRPGGDHTAAVEMHAETDGSVRIDRVLTGLELAEKHGFPKVAESGAERVSAVVEPPSGESERPGVPRQGACTACGRHTLIVNGTCANASICKTGKDGPDHYP